MSLRHLRRFWCVLRLQMDFPDGLFLDPKNQREIRVEFEYRSSHFLQHGHDAKACDLIVCWEDGLPASMAKSLGLPILSLKRELSQPGRGPYCLDRRRETNLDRRILSAVSRGQREARVIQRLLDLEIPLLQSKYSQLFGTEI